MTNDNDVGVVAEFEEIVMELTKFPDGWPWAEMTAEDLEAFSTSELPRLRNWVEAQQAAVAAELKRKGN